MKNLGLSTKVWLVIGLLVVCYVGTNALALRGIFNLEAELSDFANDVVKRDQLTSDIRASQRQLVIYAAEVIFEEDEKKLVDIKNKYDKTVEKLNHEIESYMKMAGSEEKALMAKYNSSYAELSTILNQTVELGMQNKNEEGIKVYLGASKVRYELNHTLDELNDLTANELKARTESAVAQGDQVFKTTVAVSFISIIAALVSAFFVVRSLTNSIRLVVTSLTESSLQVSSAASQIASSSEELSQSATEQAASLEETAASVEEMNSMVSKNSENANSTALTSGKSQEKATQGKAVVEKMIQSMDAINASNNTIMQQVNRSNESMAGIVKVIEEIGSKTKVINDIVFQTKLLSFNASVEAARAGEHGKGFAVVAEEVGNLAQMSGNAAKEIGSMLEDSIQKVNQIVQETKASVEKLIAEGKETVESGSLVARQCGEVLEEIVHNVASVSSMAGEIASASQEQSRGISEITKAMGQLDQMTQQNAATSEECASAAEELSAQAESLKSSVGQLVQTINGGSGQQATTEVPAMAKAPRASSGPKVSGQNVVHLKGPKFSKTGSAPQLKRVAGDAPQYNSSGFEDV